MLFDMYMYSKSRIQNTISFFTSSECIDTANMLNAQVKANTIAVYQVY
jgi:hypothetical protein